MSDDRDWRQYTRRSAMGLMGLGAGLATTETLGFTQLTAGRGVDLNIADDSNALLSIQGDGDSGGSGNLENKSPFDEPLTITFNNQAGTDINTDDLSVTVTNKDTSAGTITVTDFDGSTTSTIDNSGEFKTFYTGLSTGETTGKSLSIQTDIDDGTSPGATINIDVDAVFASGLSIELERTDIDINDTDTDTA